MHAAFSGAILMQKNDIIERLAMDQRPNLENFSLTGRAELRFCLNVLAGWFRDIYLAKTGAPPQELINIDRREELSMLAGKFDFIDLNRALDSISDSLLYLEQNINTKLLLYELGAQIWKA